MIINYMHTKFVVGYCFYDKRDTMEHASESRVIFLLCRFES